MTALITSHVFRITNVGGSPPSGRRTPPRVRPGYCCWLGTCDRPEAEHITADDYRQWKETAK